MPICVRILQNKKPPLIIKHPNPPQRLPCPNPPKPLTRPPGRHAEGWYCVRRIRVGVAVLEDSVWQTGQILHHMCTCVHGNAADASSSPTTQWRESARARGSRGYSTPPEDCALIFLAPALAGALAQAALKPAYAHSTRKRTNSYGVCDPHARIHAP